jgi:hypothetical protein
MKTLIDGLPLWSFFSRGRTRWPSTRELDTQGQLRSIFHDFGNGGDGNDAQGEDAQGEDGTIEQRVERSGLPTLERTDAREARERPSPRIP